MIEKKDSKNIVIDARGMSLGRLAAIISHYLQDKHKPSYQPNKAGETMVIVKNLKDIYFKGSKLESKKYFKHTGYLGHLKEEKLKDLWKKNPEKVLKMAVRGMLPKNKLRDKRLKRLKIEA